MATRGRKPKPTAVKTAQGNPGKRAIAGAEPAFKVGRVAAPAYLEREAKDEWNRVVPELVRLGLFATVDLSIFAMYCDAVGRFRKAKREVRGKEVITSPNGYPIQNPWLPILNKAKEQALRLAAEFGLSPVSRVRLSGTAQGDLFGGWNDGSGRPPEESDWDEFTSVARH